MLLQVRPAGSSKLIDPTPFVAGWKLLGRLTAGHRVFPGLVEGGAYGSTNPTVGQLLLAGSLTLEQAVLADPRITIGGCQANGVSSGEVDRRVLAVIEYLSYEGLAPTVTGLPCSSASPLASAASAGTQAGGVRAIGTSLQITALRGVPVLGHQQRGGVVDLAIRLLMGLQGALHPARIISALNYPWQPTALSLPDHAAALEVDMGPAARPAARPASTTAKTAATSLSTGQWTRLISRLSQLAG
jgi:hypothetical protein